MNQTLTDLTKSLTVTKLIGLGEAQRRIYDLFPEKDGGLAKAYELHQKELELLIKYEKKLTES